LVGSSPHVHRAHQGTESGRTLSTPPTVNVCAASITRSRQLRHALLACAIAQKEGEGGSNHRSPRGRQPRRWHGQIFFVERKIDGEGKKRANLLILLYNHSQIE